MQLQKTENNNTFLLFLLKEITDIDFQNSCSSALVCCVHGTWQDMQYKIMHGGREVGEWRDQEGPKSNFLPRGPWTGYSGHGFQYLLTQVQLKGPIIYMN